MNPFVPAEELKKVYGVFGHFYSVELPSREVVECRSVLEIADQTLIPQQPSGLSQRSPDAVFIMMNPGSSIPLVPVNNRIPVAEIDALPISLVPTRPDTTQYQVMRLMRHQRWKHVRVLNLSDLRSPKSPEFFKLYQRLEADSNFVAHSIFSDDRRRELAMKLPSSKQTPLVLAWGLSPQLDPLIHRCLARLPNQQAIKGLLEAGTTNKYRHPLPTLQKDKRVWLERMVRHCE